MKGFNINDYVYVKLTDLGREVYRKRNDGLLSKDTTIKLDIPEDKDVNSNGYSSFQMWSLMDIFGKHMYLGCENVFETEIIFKEQSFYEATID